MPILRPYPIQTKSVSGDGTKQYVQIRVGVCGGTHAHECRSQRTTSGVILQVLFTFSLMSLIALGVPKETRLTVSQYQESSTSPVLRLLASTMSSLDSPDDSDEQEI